jgi:uncharacterized RDD family membrane protein YckC
VHLDNRIVVATPEGIELEVVLAGLGSRFVARLIDTSIQLVIILVLSLGGYVASGGSWDGYVVAGVVILSFLVMFAYDVPFEVLNAGRTPGKNALGLRVIGHNGEPIDFVTSAVRNLLRIIDFLPLFYLVGSVAIVASQHDQRLGDHAAGTLVARERFSGKTTDLQPVAAVSVPLEQVLTWDVSSVDADEVRVLRHFLDRRLALPWPIRSYFAQQLLERFWPKVPGLPMNVHPEYILEGIVVAKQGRA